MSGKTECMIRLDDITPDMDIQKFLAVKEVLDQYGIKALLGVVPLNQDENLHKEEDRTDFFERIRNLQKEGWPVAQHGTTHVYVTEDSGILGVNPFSEFAGLSYEEQNEKIRQGKSILERKNIITDIFMAPGHSYDGNTLKALKKNGFLYVTDGLAKKPYIEEGMICIPCRLQGMKRPKGIDTICLHTNLMGAEDCKELDRFLRDNKDIMVSYDCNRYQNLAKQKNFCIKQSEKWTLRKRQWKDKIAHSGRLAWYLERTNHEDKYIKLVKRVFCLPLLLCYKKSE